MLEFLQRIGRSLMVPIAVMPAAALLLRLGAPDLLNLPFIAAAGAAIFDNLALLFAIGIAIGMSDDHRGEAVLAAVVGFLVIIGATQALLTAVPPLGAGYAADDDLVTTLSNNVLVGIVAGLIAVWTYNRFRTVKLPQVLGFFSGRRLVPILTSIFVLVVALALRFIWPPFWNGINAFNEILLGWGAPGTAVYGVLNRALIPFGLHHVLNSFFWFSVGEFTTASGEVVTGDIPRFLSGDPTAGIYQVGFYPIMMFGLVGAALAMIVMARKSERSKVFGLLGGAALVSFVTGITEPLEFAFLFAAPLLYGIHALLTGASMLVTNLMGLRDGFGFSAGLIDFLLNYGLAERPNELAMVGGVFFVIYFVVFAALIRLLDLKTPGRQAAVELTAEDMEGVMLGVSEADDELTAQAKAYINALGGASNLVKVDNCATRLRLTVADSGVVNTAQLQTLGAKGVIKPSKTAVQVIVGVESEFLADAIRDVTQTGGGAVPAAEGPLEARHSIVEALAPESPDAVAPGEADAEAAAATTPRPAPVSQARPKRPKRPAAPAHDPAVTAAVNLMIKALGGPDNIVEASTVATTRLRIVVRDPSQVNEEAIRAAGAGGVMAMEDTYHILLGMRAQLFGDELDARLADGQFA
jgi:PTS system N-acetylglucosamine-specific IIC component